MILWLLIGCPKKTASPLDDAPTVSDAVRRTPVAGPRYWSESGGLCMEVPAGWSGTAGPPPLLLELEQAGTGFRFELTASPTDRGPDREGLFLLFDDAQAYRAVPILAPDAGSRTWQSLDPAGPTVQSWSNVIGGRWVEVAATYPLGFATEGRSVVEPLFQALCTTWR